jgi:hypothetical protein
MLSVEYSTKVKKRVKFNRPFSNIEIYQGPISSVIPTFSQSDLHFLWLDYDGIISRSHLEDISLAASILPTKSVILITVDVDPPGTDSWKSFFEDEAEEYLPPEWKPEYFSRTNLPIINTHLIEAAIKMGLNGRRSIEYIPIFKFQYADGHSMITMGGMIGSHRDLRKVSGSRLAMREYARLKESDPFF